MSCCGPASTSGAISAWDLITFSDHSVILINNRAQHSDKGTLVHALAARQVGARAQPRFPSSCLRSTTSTLSIHPR